MWCRVFLKEYDLKQKERVEEEGRKFCGRADEGIIKSGGWEWARGWEVAGSRKEWLSSCHTFGESEVKRRPAERL